MNNLACEGTDYFDNPKKYGLKFVKNNDNLCLNS
jgi:hypothetical protein